MGLASHGLKLTRKMKPRTASFILGALSVAAFTLPLNFGEMTHIAIVDLSKFAYVEAALCFA